MGGQGRVCKVEEPFPVDKLWFVVTSGLASSISGHVLGDLLHSGQCLACQNPGGEGLWISGRAPGL